MADNVAITAGSGTNIATDDVSAVHYQKVKPYASTDGTEHPFTRAEDAAHTDGDHGIVLLGVRNYAGPRKRPSMPFRSISDASCCC